MFIKQEKPKMDDFERKKLVLKEKYFKNVNILRKYFFHNVSTDTLAKMPQNIFSHCFVSEHSKHYFSILRI